MLPPHDRLRLAVAQGNVPITQRLLSRFPELWLNTDHRQGWCNLHYASFNGNYLVCFHLISLVKGEQLAMPATVDMLTFDGLTVLHLPLAHHHAQTLHYLLQEFPGSLWIDHKGGSLGQTPLHYACVHDFKAGIKLFLDFGADFMAQDVNGDTCLHICFQYGFFECLLLIVRFLLTGIGPKKELVDRLKALEEVKNNRGWQAIDHAYSFDLMRRYKTLRAELVASLDEEPQLIFSGVFPPAPELSALSSTSSLHGAQSEGSVNTENRILASPIVSVAGQMLELDPVGGFDPVTKRAHLQSLPGDTTAPETDKKARQRANTAYAYRPPGPLNTPILSSPRLPGNTLSLKSVTISPLVKNAREDSDEELSLPVSVVSPFSNGSPQKKAHNAFHISQINEGQKWPSLERRKDSLPGVGALSFTPTHIPEAELPPFVSRSVSRASLDSLRSLPVLSRRSSASSIAAKLAYSASRAGTPQESRRPLIVQRGSGETSPTLRKSRSLSQVPSKTRRSRSTLSLSLSSTTILNEADETLFSSPRPSRNVSSISFSSVR